MNKKLIYIIIMLVNGGCASLPKESVNIPKKEIQDKLTVLDGRYNVEIVNGNYGKINSIIAIINRTTEDWPTIDTNEAHFLGIETVTDRSVLFTLYENENILISKTIKIKSIKDNYIYLKNNNVKIHNIPFILGGYDYLKTRLSIDQKGKLIIDSVDYGIGSFMFVIWSGTPTMKSSYTYEKEIKAHNKSYTQ
jgi:hypothetical protein